MADTGKMQSLSADDKELVDHICRMVDMALGANTGHVFDFAIVAVPTCGCKNAFAFVAGTMPSEEIAMFILRGIEDKMREAIAHVDKEGWPNTVEIVPNAPTSKNVQ